MNILYLLTYDYSFESWNRNGNFSREKKYFNEFSSKYKDINFVFITYGDENDLKYSKDIHNQKIIPVYRNIKFNNNNFIRLLKSFLIPFKLYKIIKNENIQVIKQNQLQGVWVAIIFKLLLRVPLITRTGYSVLEFKLKEKRKLFTKIFYYFITHLALTFSNIFTVTSKQDIFFLKKFFIFNKNKIYIRPNFVLIPKYSEITKRSKNFISVGRLEPQKNINYQIKEFSNSEYEIDHFGEGKLYSILLDYSKKMNTKITFKKNIDNVELIETYKKYKYYISSSIYEGNPKTILEAMAAGCVVIAPKIPNIEEIIQNNHNGFLYKLTEGSLKNTIEKVTNLTVDLEKISHNAISSVNQNNNLSDLVKNEYYDFISVNSSYSP